MTYERQTEEGNHLRVCPAQELYISYSDPDRRTLPEYFCPVCGAQLDGGDTLAENKDGDTVGCIYCIRYYEIWEKDVK